MSARTSVRWSAQVLSTRLSILSGPAALCVLTLARVLLTRALVRDSTCLSGEEMVFRAGLLFWVSKVA